MIVSDLVIEVTRKCNVRCDHCMRGDSQNVDIDNKVITALLKGIHYISQVTFTGGEPSLAVNKIKQFTKVVKEKEIEVNSFYVVTNGEEKSLDLCLALMELYDYCSDNEMTGFCISKDQYHEYEVGCVDEAESLYKALSFYQPDDRKGEMRFESIIREGRALEYGFGERDIETDEIDVEFYEEEKRIERVNSTLYVNALGDVISGCDFSYKSQEKLKIGNVLNDTLEVIYKNAVK